MADVERAAVLSLDPEPPRQEPGRFSHLLFPERFRDRFRTGIIWNFLGAASSFGTTFAVNVIVAKMLGREAFGQFTIVQNTLVTFCGLASLSMGLAATKYVAQFRVSDPGKAGRILGLCSLVSAAAAAAVSLALITLAPWIAASQLKTPNLAFSLRMGAAFLFFTALNGYQTGALAGLERYRTAGIAGLLSGVAGLAICAFSLRLWAIDGAFIGLSVSALIRYLLCRFFLRSACADAGIEYTYRGLAPLRPILFRFAIPAAISGYFTLPMFWLANLILFRQPDGVASMALYGAAASIRVMVLFLPSIVNSVGLSILNHTRGAGDMPGFVRLYWNNILAVVASVLVVAAPIALFGKTILILFGKDFQHAYPVILVLLLSAIPEALSMSLFQIIQAEERMWFGFFGVIVPREIALVALAYLLTPSLGATGLAISYGVAWTLAAIIIFAAGFRPWKGADAAAP